jgi:hypothetical protein
MRRLVRVAEVLLVLGLFQPSWVHADIWLDEQLPTARKCKTSDAERPYVCDVGPPEPLSYRSFIPILQKDGSMRDMVARMGMPDRVELQQVQVEGPWLSWELRVYYRAYDRMFAFGRAFILGNPEVSLPRYEGRIPARMWQQGPSGLMPGAEQSAYRAEQAALHAEALANRSEQLADRAEIAADRVSRDFDRRLRKH